MIREYLVPALKDRFPDRPFVYREHPQPIATIEMPFGTVGPVDICDDDDEITIYIGKAGHGHFGNYDENISTVEREQRIAADVVDFLTALFSDRVVIVRILNGWSGGWHRLRDGEQPRRSWFWEQFLWSGPLHHAQFPTRPEK